MGLSISFEDELVIWLWKIRWLQRWFWWQHREGHLCPNYDPFMTQLWPSYDPIMTWSGISRPPLDSCQGGRVQHLVINRVIITYYHHESETQPFLYSSFMIINSIISFDFFMDKHNHDRESEPFLNFSLSGSRQRSQHETCRSKWCNKQNHEYDHHDKHDNYHYYHHE